MEAPVFVLYCYLNRAIPGFAEDAQVRLTGSFSAPYTFIIEYRSGLRLWRRGCSERGTQARNHL